MLAEMAHYTIASCDGHGQSATIGLKAIVHHTVYRGQRGSLMGFFPGLGNGSLIAYLLRFRFALSGHTGGFGFAGGLFGSCPPFGSTASRSFRSLPFARLGSGSLRFAGLFSSLGRSLGLGLQSGFALFGLLDATGIFSCSSFGRGLAACQLFGTLLGSSLSSSLATGLSSGTRTCLGYLFGNEPVDLCIECSVFLALLGYDALNGALLFLQALYHILLLGLLVFKVRLLLSTFI